jgi:quinolinate synthase
MQTATISFDRFNTLADKDAGERIRAARAKLGARMVLLCHHYQRADVYRPRRHHRRLAQALAPRLAVRRRYIVFCGVHFMAEVADILSRPEQISILPDLAAGCSMADMASLAKVERAWRELAAVLDPDEKVTPVTYINSAADLKAFCGEHGGIVCTSSNAPKILDWSFAQREKVLFFPDQHLGRWTGFKMGIPLDEMVIWNPDLEQGGLTREQIAKAKIILWHGYCSVHQMFQPARHHQVPQPVSRRPRHLAPGMQLRSLQAVRLRRQHRDHPQDGQGRARRTRAGWSAPNSTWSSAWPRK